MCQVSKTWTTLLLEKYQPPERYLLIGKKQDLIIIEPTDDATSWNLSAKLSPVEPISISLAFKPDSTIINVIFCCWVYYSCCTNESSQDVINIPVSICLEQSRLRVSLRDSTQWAGVRVRTHNLMIMSPML